MQTHNQQWLEVVDQMSGEAHPIDNGYGRYEEQEFSDGEIDYQDAYRGQMMDFDEFQAGGVSSYDMMQVRHYNLTTSAAKFIVSYHVNKLL